MKTRSRIPFAALAGASLLLLPGCAGRGVAVDDAEAVATRSGERVIAQALDEPVSLTSDPNIERVLEQPLDAEQAVRIALANNRRVAVALRSVGVERGEVLQAGLLPNPTFEVELLPERETAIELRVEYELTQALLAGAARTSQKPKLEAARLEAARAIVELGLEVREAYYRLAAAESKKELIHQVVETHRASLDAVSARQATGNATDRELFLRKTELGEARLLEIDRDAALLGEREAFRRLLGLHGREASIARVTTLPEPAPNRPAEDVETRAIRANLEMQALRERLESLARQTGYVRKQGLLPDISVDVHALRENPDSPSVAATEPVWRFGAGISTEVPLFDRQQGRVGSLEASYDVLLETYLMRATALRSLARELRGRLEVEAARVAHYREALEPAAAELEAETLLQYNAMQLGLDDLLAAHRRTLSAQLGAIDARRDYWIERARLEALLRGATPRSPPGRPDPMIASETSEEEH